MLDVAPHVVGADDVVVDASDPVPAGRRTNSRCAFEKMNKTEGKAILEKELDRFRTMPYADLVASIGGGQVYTSERVGMSGATYLVEIEAFWENSAKKRVRVVGSGDESPLRPIFWNIPLLRWIPIYMSSVNWTFSRDEHGTDERCTSH